MNKITPCFQGIFTYFHLILLKLFFKVGHGDWWSYFSLSLKVIYFERLVERLLVWFIHLVLVLALLICAVMSFDHLRILLVFNAHQPICRIEVLVVTLLLDLIHKVQRPWH